MKRIQTMALVVISALAGILYLENKAVRSDQSEMAKAYEGFLGRKDKKGVPMADKIIPEKLAVVKVKEGVLACALMR